MRILIERKIPFLMSLSINTYSLEAHSALCDLTESERENIKDKLQKIFNELELLMYQRRDELSKL